MTKKFNQLEYNNIIEQLNGSPVNGIPVRVDKVYAKKMMQDNLSVISGGNVFHFTIKYMGLGIYAVTKSPLTQKDTLYV